MAIEMGDDLVLWPDVYQVPENAAAGPPVSMVKDVSPGMEQVTLLPPMPATDRKFIRLKILTVP